jgi:tetratricopeptide (TPR) repeat protein
MKRFSLSVLSVFFLAGSVAAQAGGHTLFGDIKIDEGGVSGLKPLAVEVLLYSEGGNLIARQTVHSGGRYRFLSLLDGIYNVAVEIENLEVARVRVHVASPFKTDFRQDIELQWRERPSPIKTGVVWAGESYGRSRENISKFSKAISEIERKQYDRAIPLLRQIVESDPGDFPAWEDLATLHFILKNLDEAEKNYAQALKARPNYLPALIGFGRLRLVQKNFKDAVQLLIHAVKVQPTSPQANYFLGEAYLQLKLGSTAVGYLSEALRLDPIGMADAHLRLGALYNAKGLKDKAAAEYEAFLKKRPDSPDKKMLREYITMYKK